MKKEQLYEAIGEIKETYIEEAHLPKAKKMSPWIKWSSLVASLAAVLVISFFALNGHMWNTDLPLTETTEAPEETAFGTRYVYKIDSGTFAPYTGGKVIDPSLIGEKLEDVTVIAGWITDPSQEPGDETLSAEVYAIAGVSPDVAAALWFLDKGDALTTTHYYVILNPKADLSPVSEYVIPDYLPNNPGEE